MMATAETLFTGSSTSSKFIRELRALFIRYLISYAAWTATSMALRVWCL